MQPTHQKAILSAMMAPEFYPHRVDTIVRCETHISTVFLTGPYAYKVKKPVNLKFLDFSTLEKRSHYCRQEVLLNRRLSTGVYLEALPITYQDGQFTLKGSGQTVETVVKMRQLEGDHAMLSCFQQGRLTDAQMDHLIDHLVAFYGRTKVIDPPQDSGPMAWDENLQLMEPFAGSFIDRQRYSFVCAASKAFHNRFQRLFQRRWATGKIRDGHGDLRCDHIYFLPDGIQIIDCIEFNDGLRMLDIISDLAFLAMDLEYHGFGHPARYLIQGYVKRTGDVQALPLLDFYRCYRAMVRCKVTCFMLREISLAGSRRHDLQVAANTYLEVAHGYATAFSRPTLWVVCGLPAAGKSTVARSLADIYDLAVIRSDVVRKELFAQGADSTAEPDFAGGIYSPYATEVTYNELFSRAQEWLKKGCSVIIDATFSRTMHRREALRLADRRQARAVFVECRATDATLSKRLRNRQTEPSISDARLIHLERFKQRHAPITEIDPVLHIRVSTERPLADCLQRIVLDHGLRNGSNGAAPAPSPLTMDAEYNH